MVPIGQFTMGLVIRLPRLDVIRKGYMDYVGR